MRFLQISISATKPSGPPDPKHMAQVNKVIAEGITSGAIVAVGGLGKRATSAARVVRKNGEIHVEDPPNGDNWMSGGGYKVFDCASKEEAIAHVQATLEIMGDGVIELIQVTEMHPPPKRPATAQMPLGVVPYLAIDGASDAAAFYQRAFGAREIARMPAEDGKRLMHCQLEINGGALMLSDNFTDMGAPPVQRSSSYTMQLVVPEGDRWWDRAIRAGCKEKMPFQVAPWGDKYGQLIDPFEVTWAISSPAPK
jgi:uncharacterized glyoxalase superfamily protein PhnB